MVAVDTNVVLRLLIEDDPQQAERARHLLETETFYLPLTVVLETYWVVHNVYRYSHEATIAALKAFVALPGVEVEHPGRLAAAIAWAEGAMGFADALHLAATPPGEGFASFDTNLIRLARQAGGPRAFAP